MCPGRKIGGELAEPGRPSFFWFPDAGAKRAGGDDNSGTINAGIASRKGRILLPLAETIFRYLSET